MLAAVVGPGEGEEAAGWGDAAGCARVAVGWLLVDEPAPDGLPTGGAVGLEAAAVLFAVVPPVLAVAPGVVPLVALVWLPEGSGVLPTWVPPAEAVLCTGAVEPPAGAATVEAAGAGDDGPVVGCELSEVADEPEPVVPVPLELPPVDVDGLELVVLPVELLDGLELVVLAPVELPDGLEMVVPAPVELLLEGADELELVVPPVELLLVSVLPPPEDPPEEGAASTSAVAGAGATSSERATTPASGSRVRAITTSTDTAACSRRRDRADAHPVNLRQAGCLIWLLRLLPSSRRFP